MDGGLGRFGAAVVELITADRSLLSPAEWVEFARDAPAGPEPQCATAQKCEKRGVVLHERRLGHFAHFLFYNIHTRYE